MVKIVKFSVSFIKISSILRLKNLFDSAKADPSSFVSRVVNPTSQRDLLLKSGGSSYNRYNSCLDYTCDELKSFWTFETEMPRCPGYQELYGYECNGSSGTSSNTGEIHGQDDYFTYSDDKSPATSSNGSSGTYSNTDEIHGQDDDDYFIYGAYRNDDGLNRSQNGSVVDTSKSYFASPYDIFDLSNCTSYNSYWLWDLAITCEESCQCTSTEALFEDGSLTCPSNQNPYCPQDCDICHRCLKMMGCTETTSPEEKSILTRISKQFPTVMMVLITSLVLSIFTLVAYQQRKKVKKSLVDDVPVGRQDLLEDDVWLAPLS